MRAVKTTLFCITLLLAMACKKDVNEAGNVSLTGKWRAAGGWIGIAGPPTYQAASEYKYVVFGATGSVSGTAFTNFNRYNLVDSATISLKGDGNNIQNYWYAIRHDSLFMSPRPNICIEGCSFLFVKEK